MSVINQMLRDLDRRNAAPPDLRRSGTPAPPFGGAPDGARRTTWTQAARLAVAGSLLALAMAGAWWWAQNAATQAQAPKPASGDPSAGAVPPESQKAPAPGTAAANLAAPANPHKTPAVAQARPQAATAKAPAAPSAATLPPPAIAAGKGLAVLPPPAPVPTAPAPSAAAAPKTAATLPAAAPPNAAPESVKPATPAVTATASASSAAHVPLAPSGGTTVGAVDATQRQQQAGRDALAQAQGLWSNGSKDAAMDLLRQATTAQERNQASSPSPAGRALLLALLRELTRMELADGHPAAAFDLLARLDGLTSSEPDLLALRANAAQRMGRHQDSINAYRAALQFRPAEQRWLLGAAVSMAALGQTAAATDMAERARLVGPISREVLAYLRQAGVAVRD